MTRTKKTQASETISAKIRIMECSVFIKAERNI